MTRSIRTLGAALSALIGLYALPDAAMARAPAQPHLVELFTAQGCAGCPDADQTLKGLTTRKDVIVLTFAVDYWDYLGWKDSFAKPEFTTRQAAYKTRFRLHEIYTPEFVIDGRSEAAAATAPAALETALKARLKPRVHLRRQGAQLVVSGAAPAGGADLWLVRYDPKPHDVTVAAGENRGKTLNEVNVVRELKRLAHWKGGAKHLALPGETEPGLTTLILAQTPHGGEILGLAH